MKKIKEYSNPTAEVIKGLAILWQTREYFGNSDFQSIYEMNLQRFRSELPKSTETAFQDYETAMIKSDMQEIESFIPEIKKLRHETYITLSDYLRFVENCKLEYFPGEYLIQPEYLKMIFDEFSKIWNPDLSQREFLRLFDLGYNGKVNFEVRKKGQFYYLLREMWEYRTDKELQQDKFIQPFLEKYGMSFKAFGNRIIPKTEFAQRVYNTFKKIKPQK